MLYEIASHFFLFMLSIYVQNSQISWYKCLYLAGNFFVSYTNLDTFHPTGGCVQQQLRMTEKRDHRLEILGSRVLFNGLSWWANKFANHGLHEILFAAKNPGLVSPYSSLPGCVSSSGSCKHRKKREKKKHSFGSVIECCFKRFVPWTPDCLLVKCSADGFKWLWHLS